MRAGAAWEQSCRCCATTLGTILRIAGVLQSAHKIEPPLRPWQLFIRAAFVLKRNVRADENA